MSYFDAVGNNPDIVNGQQLALRQQLGVDDMYFLNLPGDCSAPLQKLDVIDMEDRVVRRVDPTKLPLDPLKDSPIAVGRESYVVREHKLPSGETIKYVQRWDRKGPDEQKYVLIGGKLFEIEFEKDGKTYLTTQVKDLFQSDKFYKNATPEQKLQLLGQIKKASAFISWYSSGERARYLREKNGEESAQIRNEDVHQLGLDGELEKLQNDLVGKVVEQTTQMLLNSLKAYTQTAKKPVNKPTNKPPVRQPVPRQPVQAGKK